jgi:stage II sporulation protein D
LIEKFGGCLAAVLLLAHPASALASSGGESIRVAVLLHQPSLIVSSPGILIFQTDRLGEVARLRGPVEILSGGSGLMINGQSMDLNAIRIRTDHPPLILNGKAFSGTFRMEQGPGGLLAVNELDLEEYLKGVVPVEISPLWHPEVLKVQAVVARTYALYQRQVNAERGYDLVATTNDQVYDGQAQEHPASNQAIAETDGLVLSYQGNIVLSAYHSTSAGPTEDAGTVWGMDLPYLKGVECPFDRLSPRFQWIREMDLGGLQAALLRAGYSIGEIATLTPFDWTPSGRVGRIRLLHSEGQTILRGEELRRILGYGELPSTRFRLEFNGAGVRIQGRGSGHGVGLCQWGAKVMAELGYSFDQILRYYYPGVEIAAYADLK